MYLIKHKTKWFFLSLHLFFAFRIFIIWNIFAYPTCISWNIKTNRFSRYLRGEWILWGFFYFCKTWFWGGLLFNTAGAGQIRGRLPDVGSRGEMHRRADDENLEYWEQHVPCVFVSFKLLIKIGKKKIHVSFIFLRIITWEMYKYFLHKE